MSWDVFVSHNRKEKPWVRSFVQHLRDLGLSVFFDEDSIPVGRDFHHEISEALSRSQTFIFVISAASILSPWVADEIDTACHYRAATSHQAKIVPIYLEPVHFTHPGLATATPIYLTDKKQRTRQYWQLLRGLAPNADPGSLDSLAESMPWPGSRNPSDSLRINDSGQALAIGAHWDDVLLGCLGTLLRLQLLHDYTVNVAVLCTTYADRYYGQSQDYLLSKINRMYRELEERFALRFHTQDADETPLMDRQFGDKEDRVEARLASLAQSYSDCDLIFSPPPDDGHIDHAVTGRLVRSHFRQPEQMILDYEVKRYTDRTFIPNIFVNLDSSSPNGGSLGDLKVRFLSELVVNGKDPQGSAIHTEVAGSEYMFSQEPLEARLLVNALDYSGNKRIRYGEVFRGRVSL